MEKYIFRDTDDIGEADYEICGADFERLIRTCCRYASTFSVIVMGENEKLAKNGYRLGKKPKNLDFAEKTFKIQSSCKRNLAKSLYFLKEKWYNN